jgi:hypothetical protein
MANNPQGGKKNAPAPPDYMGLANQQAAFSQQNTNQQTLANRPNQSNPYASSTWTQGPNGEWSQQTAFNGPLAGANASLQQQAANNLSTPFSLSSLGTLGTGDDARNQAITGAYNQATSRLDPAFQQRENALRTRLQNQGLQEGSAAFKNAMSQFGNERNDAYTSAMNMAIGQGTAAGDSVFRNNLASRQQGLEELLRQRNMPLAEMQQMNALTGMQGFNQAGRAETPNLLGAAGMQDAANYRNWQARQGIQGDMYGAGMDLLGTGLQFLPYALASDERVKVEVERLPVEVVPGVPLATFRYLPEAGMGEGRYLGIIAQDLQKVRPEAVRPRADGVLTVHPDFNPVLLEE